MEEAGRIDDRLNPALLRALAAARQGETEQQLIERTLGRALLAKLEGKIANLSEIYRGLGGNDPVVQEVLRGRVNEAFARLPVLPGIQATREAALSDRIPAAAAAKNAELRENPLANIEGQAINTLATLGGAEFMAKYNLER